MLKKSLVRTLSPAGMDGFNQTCAGISLGDVQEVITF